MKLCIQAIALVLIFQVHLNGQAITPRVVQGNYLFDVGNVSIEVIPSIGGRISSLKLNNKEIMYVNRNSNNWGSTFWTSPQSFWNWPPPADLDPNPYTATLTGNTLVMRSTPAGSSAFRYEKRISANVADTSITITFVITNNRTTAVSVAPWEITRFPGGGITYFPQRVTGQVTGELGPLLVDIGNVSWFNFDSTRIQAAGKFFSDGTEGWLAHVRRTGELVLKKFTDSSPAQKAPNPENEIEHYVSGDKSYQEVEQQGAYRTLEAGQAYEWTVKWLVRQVPRSISLTSGNAALVAYTRGVSNRVLSVSAPEAYNGKFLLYPNPAKKIICIQSEDQMDAGSLRIYALSGQQVNCHTLLNADVAMLDVSCLPAGMYFMHCSINNQAVRKEFIIE